MKDAVAGLEVAEPEVDGAGGEHLVPLQQATGTSAVTTQPPQLGQGLAVLDMYIIFTIFRKNRGLSMLKAPTSAFVLYQDATKLIIDGSINFCHVRFCYQSMILHLILH